MKAYVISLHSPSCESNRRLSGLLCSHGFEVVFINAVRGSEMNAQFYYFSIQEYLRSKGRILTPAEVGCAMSHRRAYEDMLVHDDAMALVLEDDVILDGAGCKQIAKLAKENSVMQRFVHLGGMECLERDFNRVRGCLVSQDPPLFRVFPQDMECLHRMVGYLVPRNAAHRILELLNDHVFLIDDFPYIWSRASLQDLYFSKIVAHPASLGSSAIECERAAFTQIVALNSKSLFRRLMNEISKTVRSRVKRAGWLMGKSRRIVVQLASRAIKAY